MRGGEGEIDTMVLPVHNEKGHLGSRDQAD